MEKHFCCLGLGKDFLDRTQKHDPKQRKQMICKTSSKFKISLKFSKDTMKKMKRKVMGQEKVFLKYLSDKGLVSEYIKCSYNLIRQTTQLKMGKYVEKTFHQRWLANKDMKRCSSSFVIWK